jgi:acetyl-CoA synthetase
MTSTSNTIALRASRDRLVTLSHDYDAAIDGFAWPATGETFNWAVEWFDAIAENNDRIALWIVEEDGSERKVSFAELSERSTRLAAWLRTRGVALGDRVMIMLANQVELWETMLAVMKLGAVIMPSATALTALELTDRMERGEIRHVVVNAVDAAKFDHLDGEYTRTAVGEPVAGWTPYSDFERNDDEFEPAVTLASDPLLVYFTSGTTSKPKMVEHTQVSYPIGHLTTMYWIGLRPGDVHMAISAPGWAKHAWSLLFAPWNAEATIFVYNYARFNAATLVAQLDRAGVTTFCAPPTVWRMIIQAAVLERPGAMRELVSAGEPLNPEVIAQVRARWGMTIRDGYGQTELTASIANTPGSDILPGAMGRPLPGVPIVLVDPITGVLGDEGELCVDLAEHPLTLMTGYLGDPERDAEVKRGGFYHTGDVATRDSTGQLTYIGRTDDIFKSSDYKVSPFEVESLLLVHPAVAEAAVVPAPHDIRLNTVKAYVVLAAGWEPDAATAEAILRHARETMPSYMRPRRIEFADLPKTISGKIRRVELRVRESDAAEAGIEIDDWREEQFPGLRPSTGSGTSPS